MTLQLANIELHTGVTVEIVAEDNKFKALFYQDAEMHLVYQTYPELIMVDAT